ncbi:DUF4981 domain-containing protein [Streptomyces mangrovisoli]|uniref:DUF4981 domain-containing protein n=1 Tax=Streptomyces mangrovisoli TaxID=1428628 RepID=UPI0030B802A0
MIDRRPAPRPHAGPHERGTAAPVWIKCHRHEGVVVGNHRRLPGLGGLAGEWRLALADGRTLTGPARLPDLRPGETAAVPLPFAVPAEGGEAWLTLWVTLAEARPWAPRGTVVCAPRTRLRGPAGSRPSPGVGPVKPVGVDVDAVGPVVRSGVPVAGGEVAGRLVRC